MGQTEIVHVPRAEVVRAEDFMPMMTVEQAIDRKKQMNRFISDVMVEGEDYGPMPGDNRKDKKKVLLKPGAEKLCSIFGLAPRYVKETIVEDWTGAQHGGEPLFYYEYRCQLYRGDKFMGEGIGSCNTWEAKYRYRWVKEEDIPSFYDRQQIEEFPRREAWLSEPAFAINRAETTGKYGKPAEYWDKWKRAIESGEATKVTKQNSKGEDMAAWEMGGVLYRIPNPDVADLVNTCQKIGQKRAQVAAVLVVTNCSDAFTQDLDDLSTEELGQQRNTPAEQKDLAAKRIAEEKEKTANGTPAELKPFFEAIDKDPGKARPAFDHMFRLLSDLGAEGAKEYGRIADAFEQRWGPHGTSDKGALKGCITELYKAYVTVKAKTPAAQEPLIPEVVK